MSLTPAQIKPKSFESRRNCFLLLFLFTRGGCASCLRACLGAKLLLQSYQYPNLSEGADRVGGQLRGDKECPFSGVTKSGSLEEGAGNRCSECGRKLEDFTARCQTVQGRLSRWQHTGRNLRGQCPCGDFDEGGRESGDGSDRHQ